MGSLITALASFLQARSQQGHWLIRIDDLDEPRCIQGMDSQILNQLEGHGLFWDEVPRYQKNHLDEYLQALRLLKNLQLLYACQCTRITLSTNALHGPDGPVYAGICRNLGLPLMAGLGLRLRLPAETAAFSDGWQGDQHRDLMRDIGDFIVRRRDGQIGYQLACAVDEARQGITEVVRGSDLLSSTFCQRHLQQLLHLPRAQYRHLPVLVDSTGKKFSKQNHAAPVDGRKASSNLYHCLQLLNQAPPEALAKAPVNELVSWGILHWSPERVPRRMSLLVE